MFELWPCEAYTCWQVSQLLYYIIVHFSSVLFPLHYYMRIIHSSLSCIITRFFCYLIFVNCLNGDVWVWRMRSLCLQENSICSIIHPESRKKISCFGENFITGIFSSHCQERSIKQHIVLLLEVIIQKWRIIA